MSQKRFSPEFGATSFVLAVFALAFGWLAGHVAQTLRRGIPHGNAAVYWGVAALIVVLAAAGAVPLETRRIHLRDIGRMLMAYEDHHDEIEDPRMLVIEPMRCKMKHIPSLLGGAA